MFVIFKSYNPKSSKVKPKNVPLVMNLEYIQFSLS